MVIEAVKQTWIGHCIGHCHIQLWRSGLMMCWSFLRGVCCCDFYFRPSLYSYVYITVHWLQHIAQWMMHKCLEITHLW